MILVGDAIEVLRGQPDNHFHACATDPPAGISFMGKSWDSDKGGREEWVRWLSQIMSECLRVLKPGGHALVWAIPRTSHWTGEAMERAGFEMRDVITHLYGSGFPKSLDVSKAIDKAAGDAAKQWSGWGTALKPACEFYFLARKPLSEKTVAANVLKWGTGGLNIDGGRIGLKNGEVTHGSGRSQSSNPSTGFGDLGEKRIGVPNLTSTTGRFPANLVLSHNPGCREEECEPGCAVAMLDEQSIAMGVHSAGKARKAGESVQDQSGGLFGVGQHEGNGVRFGDSGGASRFFYCAKASRRERNAGLEGMPEKQVSRMITGSGKPSESVKERRAEGQPNRFTSTQTNHHPTVKPVSLMRYLCRLITPKGGTILDPFAGSGTTGVAAKKEGFEFLGIEQDPEYAEIARARMINA